MILDNLTRAFKTQNWFAVATEFVIVIAGVVIGFQIQAWNEDRIDRAAGEKALADLITETARSVNYLEVFVTNYAESIALQERVVAAISTGVLPPDMSQETFIEGISLVRRFSPPEPPRSVYDSLIATGQIELIADESVPQALSDFYTTVSIGQKYIANVSTGITAAQPEYHPAIRSIYDPEASDRRRFEADFHTLADDPSYIEASVDMLRANIVVQNTREIILEEARNLLETLCATAERDTGDCLESAPQ